MYKAVFLDMDGTLLRSDHSVSEPTKEMIRHLTSRDIPVILVSARPLNAILPTFRSIGIPGHYPLVSLNGSYIVEQERPVFDARIDLDIVASVSEKVRPFKATIAYYLQRQWFAEWKDAWTDHEQRITDITLEVAPLADLLQDWGHRNIAPNKMMVMGEAASINEIQRHLKSVYNGALNIYPSKPTYLEVMDPRGSKSGAVNWLIQRMNIDRKEVIAMGDNYNDREMIEFAGMGVAMGNAPDEIKAVADYVTDTNNNDGVRKALERFFG
ncbi:MAG: HAD family phosphatase [Chitinophagaceae bacterium]|nr:HAD family phosphatase [Chitinophagaceae bacterium]